MHKVVLIALIFASSAYGSYWSIGFITKEGLSSRIECKHGYLVDKIYGVYRGSDIYVEQSHCTNVSSWDRDCSHAPIPCTTDKKAETEAQD